MLLKRILPLLLAIVVGYTLGYQDAYRGASSLGWKLGALVDRIHPDNVRAARAKNADAIRQKAREGVPVPD